MPLTGCETETLLYQYVTRITKCLYMLCVGQLHNVWINKSVASREGVTYYWRRRTYYWSQCIFILNGFPGSLFFIIIFFIYSYCGTLIDVHCRHNSAAVVIKSRTMMKLFRSVFVKDGWKPYHSHCCNWCSSWYLLNIRPADHCFIMLFGWYSSCYKSTLKLCWFYPYIRDLPDY